MDGLITMWQIYNKKNIKYFCTTDVTENIDST